MGRAPCCEKVGLKKGRWTKEEDSILSDYIKANGEGSWRSLPKNAGLLRCGKSCRLRWINYLRDDVKRGNISIEEEEIIIKLHAAMGNRWSLIAGHLPGRTDNEIKNYWNSHLSRSITTFRQFNKPTDDLVVDLVKVAAASKRKGGRRSRSKAKKKLEVLSLNGKHDMNNTVESTAKSPGTNETKEMANEDGGSTEIVELEEELLEELLSYTWEVGEDNLGTHSGPYYHHLNVRGHAEEVEVGRLFGDDWEGGLGSMGDLVVNMEVQGLGGETCDDIDGASCSWFHSGQGDVYSSLDDLCTWLLSEDP